jgi:hypothetical protein
MRQQISAEGIDRRQMNIYLDPSEGGGLQHF